MSVLKFLNRRECGEKKHQKNIQELLEARAAEPTINQSCQLLGQARSTFLMDFSADRRKIASTHGDHSVRVTDLATGKCTHVLTGHPRTPWCLAFHPSSNEILASGCLGGEVRIWDLHGGGSEVYRSPGDHVIASMTFHPSDHVLVFATSNEIYFWDWCKPEPFTCCRTREDFERIRWVRFGPLGHNLYTGIANGSTIQRDDTSHISHISDPSSDARYDTRQRMLRQRYRTLLTRFQAYQNDRSHGSDSRSAAERDVTGPALRTDGRGSQSDEHVIISIGRHSPAHEEALDMAQEYAAHVTETTARLRNSRNYAATVTQDVRRAMLFEQHGLNRPIPQGPELQARLRSARERASLGQESSRGAQSSASNRMLRRGACSPPPRREVASIGSHEEERNDSSSQRFYESNSSDLRNISSRSRDLSSIQRPLFINTTTESSRAGYSPRDTTQAESVMEAWNNSIRHSLPSPLASVSNSNRTVCQHSPSAACPRGGRTASPGGGCNSILRTRLNTVQDSTSLPGGSASHSSAQKPGPVVIFGREESAIWRPSSSAGSVPTSGEQHAPGSNRDSITSAQNICSNSTDSTVSVTHAEPILSSSSSCETSRTSAVDAPSTSGLNISKPISSACASTNSVSSRGISINAFKSITSPNSKTTEPMESVTIGNVCVSSVHSVLATTPCVPTLVASTTSGNATVPTTSSVSVTVASTSSADTVACTQSVHATGISTPIVHASTANTQGYMNSNIAGVSSTTSSPRSSISSIDRYSNNEQSLRPLPQSGLPSPQRISETQTRPAPDLSLLGFRRIPSEALLATSVLPVSNVSSSRAQNANTSSFLGLDQAAYFDGDSLPSAQVTSITGSRNTGSASGSRNTVEEQALQSANLESPVPILSATDANDEHTNIRNMTSRLAQEINVLGRMIAMRERFSVRLQALQNERNEAMASRSGGPSSPSSGRIPEITITEHQVEPPVPAASHSDQQDRVNSSPLAGPSQPNRSAARPHLNAPPESALQGLDRTWHTLQRRHLHPHYGVSILDETINRPNDALQAAINRAIAGAFMGTGEAAVASNIINLTHRIQCWDFSQCLIPDISQANTNIVVPHCKIHNDASCDISQDGTCLATFVPSHRGFPDDTILAVFSLLPGSLGDCLFTKSFGPNAISVSLSPLKTHLVVGLASRRLSWVYTTSQVVGQVYKLRQPRAGEASMELVTDIHHPCDLEIQSHISVNSVRWLPEVGEGVIYGTNRGDLHICRPGPQTIVEKEDGEDDIVGQADDRNMNNNNIRHNLIHISQRLSQAIQTLHRARRSASTQTEQAEGENPQERPAE